MSASPRMRGATDGQTLHPVWVPWQSLKVWYTVPMTPKLTDEMREALVQHPDSPLRVRDESTQKLYVLVPEDDLRRMLHEELLRELKIGFDQADRGQVVSWDAHKVKVEGRRRLQRRSKAA